MDRKNILQHIKKSVRKVSPGAKIILYGSEARGEAEPDSDIDVLILADTEEIAYKEKIAITDAIYDIELKTGVIISPLVYTQKQWDNRPFMTPFYINVMNEGISL
ncbi:MAG: nucleotidyltransferase domain-containing protein [Candidatus Paceibacterota bacterium]